MAKTVENMEMLTTYIGGVAATLMTVCPKCGRKRDQMKGGKPANFCTQCGYEYKKEVLLNESR